MPYAICQLPTVNYQLPSHFAFCSACSKGRHGIDFGTPAGKAAWASWGVDAIKDSLEAAMSLTKPSSTGFLQHRKARHR